MRIDYKKVQPYFPCSGGGVWCIGEPIAACYKTSISRRLQCDRKADCFYFERERKKGAIVKKRFFFQFG